MELYGILSIVWGMFLPYIPNMLAILVVVAGSKIILGSTSWILRRVYKYFNIPRGNYLRVRFLFRILTHTLTFFLVLLFIPGVDEKVLAIVGIGIGVFVSLSSTTTIGNGVAGIIFKISRPIHEGDRVEIAGTTGDVVAIDLLFVHVKTIKDEIVSIPALQALNGKIVNYSELDKVIAHVSVTLGYDLDPGVAEKLLMQALYETTDVLVDPKPFILITELYDYTVLYQANGYTDKPHRLENIRSQLRRNIIKQFSKEGVQIMSPAYVNIMELQDCEKVIPNKVSLHDESVRQKRNEKTKDIVEAKHKLEEKKRENIRIEDA